MKIAHKQGEAARLAAIARVAINKGLGGDAARLREALEELGPTFVKFGQMISQREDLFPAPLVAELRSLQDRAGTFPAAQARQIIEEDTGTAVSALFASFDDEPMAAASIAQVHRAALPDGTPVIVKVQRPGIAATLEGDIAVLRRLAGLVSAAMPSMRALNLVELVGEFAANLRAELDFRQEARNAERFARANRGEPLVFVPKIFPHASSRRVPTMEHGSGRRIDEAEPLAGRPAMAAGLMRLFLTHVFEHGIFHADPHPGNILLLADGRICFLDFGAIGELSPRVQEGLRQLFLAVMARDAGWVASAYLEMGGATAELDRAALTSDLAAALDRYYRESGMGIAQAYRMTAAARGLIGRLERGEPLFDIRHQSGGSIERHLLHASNRLSSALIVASIVIGSAILLGAHAGPRWEGLPLLGIAGFAVAGVLGIAWAALALKSGKL